MQELHKFENGIKHDTSFKNIIKQYGIEHNSSSNVIKKDRINALILFHSYLCRKPYKVQQCNILT
jgi:hypothetical protein